MDKNDLLQEYTDKHNSGTCDCDEENMQLCIGGQYINGLVEIEEVFEEWD